MIGSHGPAPEPVSGGSQTEAVVHTPCDRHEVRVRCGNVALASVVSSPGHYSPDRIRIVRPVVLEQPPTARKTRRSRATQHKTAPVSATCLSQKNLNIWTSSGLSASTCGATTVHASSATASTPQKPIVSSKGSNCKYGYNEKGPQCGPFQAGVPVCQVWNQLAIKSWKLSVC